LEGFRRGFRAVPDPQPQAYQSQVVRFYSPPQGFGGGKINLLMERMGDGLVGWRPGGGCKFLWGRLIKA
jgi:hypothetical protein